MSRGGLPRSLPIRSRTCIGCRRRDESSVFTRWTLSGEGLRAGAAGGRGAYLCGAPDCMTKGAKAMGRALRRPGLQVTPGQLRSLAGSR
jgi:predicted RNA-binding protein YlxR (DUF448 family)